MRTMAICKRIILQLLHDRRSLLLILFAPIFLMTLIYLLLGDSNYEPTLLTYGLDNPILSQLQDQDMELSKASSIKNGISKLKDQTYDAFFYEKDQKIHLLFESSDSVLNSKISKKIQQSLSNQSGHLSSLETSYLYGKTDESLFDSMGYIMLAIMSFFIIFILSGISFLREKTSQTMERLLLTSIRRHEVILGYTLGFGFFAVIESILLLIYSILILKIPVAGSVFAMAFIMILLSISAVCMGAFFSIFSNNEFQVVQFIPIIVIPQIFFSGLISLKTIPFHLGILSKIMPVYYATDALKNICVRGESYGMIANDILALLVFIVLFFVLNTLLLKKYRTL